MRPDPTLLIWAAVGGATAIIIFALAWDMKRAYGGEHQLCHLEPGDAASWSYRTKVGGRQEKCWYDGPRMKPRYELYWAEAPAIPREPWQQENRWVDPTGRSHQE